MSDFDQQRTAITAATDELIASVKTPSDVSAKGVNYIRYLEDEIRRVKAAYRAAKVPLPLGKGGRGRAKATPQPVAEAA